MTKEKIYNLMTIKNLNPLRNIKKRSTMEGGASLTGSIPTKNKTGIKT